MRPIIGRNLCACCNPVMHTAKGEPYGAVLINFRRCTSPAALIEAK
jgi:hypothetical protein